MGEYALRTADVVNHFSSDSTATATVATGDGMNFSLGYLFKNNWEIATRFTQINPEAITGNESQQQYTLGVSRYIVGHKLKVQADVSYRTENNASDNELMYRLQIDLHF
jgi:phosphate-selective porin OprO and OprP